MSLAKLSIPDEIAWLLVNGPNRVEVGRKQLTLAFGGLYLASTTLSSKPLLVWETEKGYPRYYVPTESLHGDVKAHVSGEEGKEKGLDIKVVKGDSATTEDAAAVIERLSVGEKSTTWVRFLKGPLDGFIRFERSEFGE